MYDYIFSGEVYNTDKALSINNRAFRYADGLFESMFFTNEKILFIEQHYDRLLEGMTLLRIETTNLPNKEELIQLTKKLISKNNIESAARVRLQVFRKSGGLYLPETNECDYILEVSPMENNEYTLNIKGLHIGITNELKHSKYIFSKIKTTSKQEMVLAALDAKDKGWDDAILINSSNNIVETSNSNIFAVINGNIYTPTINDGVLNGIMRSNIIRIAKENNISIIETSLTEKNLIAADEIFLSNAVKGVQWVVAYGSKRYFNTMSKKIVALLNKEIYE